MWYTNLEKEKVNVVFDTEGKTYSLFSVSNNKKIVLSEIEMDKLFDVLDKIEKYK